MADSKTTALTELTSFDGDEEFYVVDDDDGTPVSKRVTIENLTTEVTDGIADAIANGDASTLTSAQTYADGKVSNTAYGSGWDTDTTHAASKNAIYDEMELRAPKASPTFTGTPAAPTASQGTNTTQVATTAYVQTEVGLLVPKSLFDANTMLYATTDNTPAALTIAASRIVGRKATGDITALTGAEAGDIIGVYTAYTPTISGGATSVTTSSLTARYNQTGKRVHAYGKAVVSSAGAAAPAEIKVTLPVAPSTTINVYPVGTGHVEDVSNGATGTYRATVASIVTSGTPYIRFFDSKAAENGNAVGEDPSFALASGDLITWNITYEAA